MANDKQAEERGVKREAENDAKPFCNHCEDDGDYCVICSDEKADD